MTPFEARGWTKDMKFVVTPDESRRGCHKEGTVVWLKEDDGSICPAFTDGTVCFYYDFWELDPIVNEETDRSNAEVNKDTIFNLKLTGEELVYLAVALGGYDGSNQLAYRLDCTTHDKVDDLLEQITDSMKHWHLGLEALDYVISDVFSPQETPEQKQYKELLAQREALDVQLAQLGQKLNLKEKVGGV